MDKAHIASMSAVRKHAAIWISTDRHWYMVQDHEDLSGGLFEDEDTRVFYEDLPNLRDLSPEVSVPSPDLLLFQP